jgi:phosphatidylserine/phosphatidylglycerophosphate/cardiolipin synthase-like enzyme
LKQPFQLAIKKNKILLLTCLYLFCSSCSTTALFLPYQADQLQLPNGIDIRFNQLKQRSYKSPITGKQRAGDDLENFIIEHINRAEKEILIAVQEFSLPKIANALIAKHRQGIIIKVIIENNYAQPWSTSHAAGLPGHQQQRILQLSALADLNRDGVLSADERHNGDAIALLNTAGVALKNDTADGSKGSGLMHHKFIVVDGKQVIFGSANFSSSDLHGDANAPNTRGNANHLFAVKSIAFANIFKTEFEKLWSNQFGINKKSGPVQEVKIGDSTIQVLFAPHTRDDQNHGINLIAQTLGQAKQTIDLALFVFSAQNLSEVLEDKARKGVKIRALVDPGFANRSYSELHDMMGFSLPDKRCKLEPHNKPWQKPIYSVGIPKLAAGDKLHHKLAIIDSKVIISGSFNWSPSAAHSNDETLVIIHSNKLAKHFNREMERLWAGSRLGITEKLKKKIAKAERFCGKVM